MPLDPSFRSRLREALHQSRARVANPAEAASNPAEAGLHCEDASEPRTDNLAKTEFRADAGDPAGYGSRLQPDCAARDLQVERQFETEEERRRRVDDQQAAWIADGLGGWWDNDGAGTCLVVDRVYPADRVHGGAEIGHYAETLSRYEASLRTFDSIPAATTLPPLFSDTHDRSEPGGPFVFFDLETTGLSGGAGTCAFLIGYGWFECGSFRTRQYFLGGYGHEPAMLRMAGGIVDGATLTSFNGKTFDVPLITGRYLYHRLSCPFDAIRHVDLLHPARRLWRHRPAEYAAAHDERREAFARYFRMTRSTRVTLAGRGPTGGTATLSPTAASCALGALEEAVLAYRRTGDVPGGEIPGRYFQYVRTGDVRPLAPVLEHNRLDLVSLAALASVVARMLQEGPDAARNAHECLALGRLYEHSGAVDRATACYEKAVEGDAAAQWRRDELVEREALRRLAIRHRREGRHQEAAAAWQRLLDLPGDRRTVDFEALHALAVHYEHRSKDLRTARALVARALEFTWDRRTMEALGCRLARIERKISTGKY